MIKNILIAALFIALSAFAISATLKSSPEPASPKKEEPKEYANVYAGQSFFKDVAEAKIEKQSGIKISIPESFHFLSDDLYKSTTGNHYYSASHYVLSIPEGTIVYDFNYLIGYTIYFYSKK